MPSSERFTRGLGLRGIGFPIVKGREGFWPRRNAAALRQSSILMILGTIPGERLMLPEFGSRLHELIFEPNDEVLQTQLIAETAGALARWDPNLRVLAVYPEVSEDQVKVFIDYIDLADDKQEPRQAIFALPRK